jgi:hypothetical protein
MIKFEANWCLTVHNAAQKDLGHRSRAFFPRDPLAGEPPLRFNRHENASVAEAALLFQASICSITMCVSFLDPPHPYDCRCRSQTRLRRRLSVLIGQKKNIRSMTRNRVHTPIRPTSTPSCSTAARVAQPESNKVRTWRCTDWSIDACRTVVPQLRIATRY